jgi:hypothetical protein
VTIYVAASNLVPEIQGQRGWRMPLALLGAVAFFLSKDCGGSRDGKEQDGRR